MNILIVDDDQFLLNDTVEGVDWKSLSVERIFTANNGFQAQEILKEHEISLVITDIEMPGMSGLELIRWVQSQQMDCKCVLLSGHASFSYAQEAISLQSSQYLLKPITNEELYGAIARVLGDEQKKRTKTANDSVNDRQGFWMEYAEQYRQGVYTRESENRRKQLYGERQDLFVLLLNEPETESRQWGGEARGHRYKEMAVEAWKDLGAQLETIIFWCRKQWAIIGIAQTGTVGQLSERFTRALQQEGMEGTIFYFEERNLSVPECFEKLNQLSETALKAITEITSCVNVAEWNRRRDSNLESYYPAWKKEIKSADHLREVGEKICDLVEEECQQAHMTREVFVRLRMVLSQLLFVWLEQQKLHQFVLFDEDEFKEKYERSIHSLNNMRHFIVWVFTRMEGCRYSDSPRSSIVRKIKAYVDKHLAEDMSRKEIANLICLSENYVSTIFSEETGESIPGYITRMRMEKAKEYLRNTDWVVSRISVEVGYTNFSYFSKVFKEYTGKTPNAYRKG